MEDFHFLFLFYTFTLALFLDTSFAVDTIAPNQSLRGNQTLVSSGGRYELGFFRPGNSMNQYLGIWFKVASSTVVWVANRNNPITDSAGVLSISSEGIIVLLNGTEDVVWSSNSSKTLVNPVVQILETGNLVVRDRSSSNPDSYIWQSFDYPCDTLLPGMKLGWSLKAGRDWSLSSWKNANDPSPGDYTYSFDHGGLPQLLLRNGPQIQFRSGPWDRIRSGGDLKTNPVFKPIIISNKDELYYRFEDNQKSTISRLIVNQSGSLEHYTWNHERHEWVTIITLHKDKCDNYALCGAYGTCNINDSPICKCPNGFQPKSPEQWNTFDYSAGCVRRFQLACKEKEGFRKFTRMKLPDKSQFSNTSSKCKRECLARCSCTAYAETEESGCIMWFGDLLDIRELSNGGLTDLYIRMAADELNSSDKKKKVLIITLLSVALVAFLLGSVSWFIFWKQRRGNKEGKNMDNQARDNTDEGQEENLELQIFDFPTIAAATNNFSFANKIGEGGFGPVYKGQLFMGQDIAVKTHAKDSGQGINEFKNEVMLIAKLQHRNLVMLLGCCTEGEERMLIYEYMPNKSLDTLIFDKTRRVSLNWQKRFDIIVGIARGLLYLHQDSRLRIIHRDLKASNILLDNNMNPKISDFGAAKTFGGEQTKAKTKRVVGTYGYMSPEYAIDGLYSMKSDVFSFGVLMLEIISGEKNRGFYHPDHDLNLLGHVWKLWNEGKALELMDAKMEIPVPLPMSEVLRCIHVGLLCVQQHPDDRPIMSTVILMLGSDAATLPQPKQPGFSTERFLTDNESVSPEKKSYTGNELTATMFEGR